MGRSYLIDSSTSSNLINGSAVALLGFLFLLSQTQVIASYNTYLNHFSSPTSKNELEEKTMLGLGVPQYLESGYSIIGIHAGSAVGLLGLLLFINLLRVWINISSHINAKSICASKGNYHYLFNDIHYKVDTNSESF